MVSAGVYVCYVPLTDINTSFLDSRFVPLGRLLRNPDLDV
jgi:hypothetical protein